ncbi:MAG: hypothetical protein C0514_01625 [Candidatus Puniceispirillum sp.]|nr:hypothetical protein [Candidatus Puniceispirillum sp.]
MTPHVILSLTLLAVQSSCAWASNSDKIPPDALEEEHPAPATFHMSATDLERAVPDLCMFRRMRKKDLAFLGQHHEFISTSPIHDGYIDAKFASLSQPASIDLQHHSPSLTPHYIRYLKAQNEDGLFPLIHLGLPALTFGAILHHPAGPGALRQNTSLTSVRVYGSLTTDTLLFLEHVTQLRNLDLSQARLTLETAPILSSYLQTHPGLTAFQMPQHAPQTWITEAVVLFLRFGSYLSQALPQSEQAAPLRSFGTLAQRLPSTLVCAHQHVDAIRTFDENTRLKDLRLLTVLLENLD